MKSGSLFFLFYGLVTAIIMVILMFFPDEQIKFVGATLISLGFYVVLSKLDDNTKD
jgi:hypothetical protein